MSRNGKISYTLAVEHLLERTQQIPDELESRGWVVCPEGRHELAEVRL